MIFSRHIYLFIYVLLSRTALSSSYELYRSFPLSNMTISIGAMDLCADNQRLYLENTLYLQLPEGDLMGNLDITNAFQLGLDAGPDCANQLRRIESSHSSRIFMRVFSSADGENINIYGFNDAYVGPGQVRHNNILSFAMGLTFDLISDHYYFAGNSGGGVGQSVVYEVDLKTMVPIHLGGGGIPISVLFLKDIGIETPSGIDMSSILNQYYITDAKNNALYLIEKGEFIRFIDQTILPGVKEFRPVIIDSIYLSEFGIIQPQAVAYNPLDDHLFISDGTQPLIIELAPVNAAHEWELYE